MTVEKKIKDEYKQICRAFGIKPFDNREGIREAIRDHVNQSREFAEHIEQILQNNTPNAL